MRLHQIRYVDHVFIYDLIWNLLACFMIIMGLFQINKARNSPSGKTS